MESSWLLHILEAVCRHSSPPSLADSSYSISSSLFHRKTGSSNSSCASFLACFSSATFCSPFSPTTKTWEGTWERTSAWPSLFYALSCWSEWPWPYSLISWESLFCSATTAEWITTSSNKFGSTRNNSKKSTKTWFAITSTLISRPGATSLIKLCRGPNRYRRRGWEFGTANTWYPNQISSLNSSTKKDCMN